jgi:hypothetical protein
MADIGSACDYVGSTPWRDDAREGTGAHPGWVPFPKRNERLQEPTLLRAAEWVGIGEVNASRDWR